MTRLTTALVLAASHMAIVTSLGAKLVVDRARLPRVWTRTAPLDPSLPVRGRYVRLRIEAEPSGDLAPDQASSAVSFTVRDDRLVAVTGGGTVFAQIEERNGQKVAVPYQALAYFIPSGAPDPSRRQAGEELWVELTVPRQGLPRPIRLGVKREGILTPLP
jgi:hypothetical protein